MDVTIRRLENNLTTLGTGIIVFGFWSLLKFAVSYFTLGDQMFEETNGDIDATVIFFSWLFAVLFALVYLWLGLCARAEGNGKRKSLLYLIVIGVIATLSTLIIAAEVLSLFLLKDEIDTVLITLVIDLTRMIFLIELFYSSIKLRHLRTMQQAKGKKEANAA
jgi:hypothetical protein